MRQYVYELPSSLHIIRVPRLCDAGVEPLNLPNEGEEPDAIGNNGEGVPLGHALLAVQEVT